MRELFRRLAIFWLVMSPVIAAIAYMDPAGPSSWKAALGGPVGATIGIIWNWRVEQRRQAGGREA